MIGGWHPTSFQQVRQTTLSLMWWKRQTFLAALANAMLTETSVWEIVKLCLM